ncbi:cancer-related nucleoside-triphosphatase isoform X2 [Sciurus carolinensis]|uniref:cancer-related nucleoside-triphosphatase isoform X2 n=1 Tax=Sciurus carolinensis TaxID=30640 RepID=UPI001FB2EACA|nr:cancer-related nucleoside-triphosphatase isoform X2 [Sciurus carolinensis]
MDFIQKKSGREEGGQDSMSSLCPELGGLCPESGTDASLLSEPMPGKRECRVGQYVVDVASFEQLALPILRNVGSCGGLGPRVCVIDEIGKMELFSQPFIQAVRQTLSSPATVVLGTIPAPKGKPLALVEEIRGRPDVKVFSVTKENRTRLLPDVVACVQSCGK